MIDHLMIFAAGLGRRMKNLTFDTPKPLIKVNGKPLLHYTLEFALQYNRFKKIVINTHYLADKIVASVDDFKSNYSGHVPEIVFAYEDPILETGGAIKNAYKYFHDQDAIFTLNSDAFLVCNDDPFKKMEDIWDPQEMDFLLLISEHPNVVGQPANDFAILPDGKLVISKDKEAHNKWYTYTGLELVKPHLVYSYPQAVFPIGEVMLQSKNYGVINNGIFYHANSEEHIQIIENSLLASR